MSYGNFLWDGKLKGKVKRELCMLPKGEGGLDMPDIGNIISTRRIKFVSNAIYLPKEKWNYSAQYFFTKFDKFYDMRYFLLNVTDSSHFLENDIPDFYKDCILNFQKYIRAIKSKDPSKNEILNEIIWHNHKVRFNGVPLNLKHWGKCGLISIKYIITSR